MMIFSTFFYYIFFASIVLVYGIGLNKISEFGISSDEDIAFYSKAILTIFMTSSITWFIDQKILIPLKLLELAPLICLLVFICVNSLMQMILLIITGKKSSEFTVSYLIILLSVTESNTILNTLIINASCMLALLILLPICYAFKSRLIQNGNSINEKYYSIFFIFLGILILVTSTVDIIWFNPGVLQ